MVTHLIISAAIHTVGTMKNNVTLFTFYIIQINKCISYAYYWQEVANFNYHMIIMSSGPL